MAERETEESGTAALTEREIADVEGRAQLRSPVIYETVRRQGDEEMSRPLVSLWWSGVAAGLSISFSLLAQAILHLRLPEAGWRPLIEALGYPVGFLIVVLSRQQLFTENTITPVLPVMQDITRANLWRLARLWLVVFAANMAGTFLSALFCAFTPAVTDELRGAMLTISGEMIAGDPATMFFRGVPSGFLLAAMVWALPNADTAKFFVIALLTYLIALGGFTHIVAGSVEAFLLVVSGELGLGAMLGQFTAPVLAGNIVGGAALFALISYAQVMSEI